MIKASIEFAERGGNILVDIRKQADIGEQSKGGHDDVKEGPGSNDPVTQGDFQSHMAMTFAFKKYFPTIHVVSEEWLFLQSRYVTHVLLTLWLRNSNIVLISRNNLNSLNILKPTMKGKNRKAGHVNNCWSSFEKSGSR